MTPQENFAQILAGIRAGRESAASELVSLFMPIVRKAARLYGTGVAVQARFDSEDVAQSAFGFVFKHLATGELTFETPDQLAAYLVRIARTRLVDRIRHANGRGKSARPRELGDGYPVEPPADEPGPPEVAEAADLFQKVGARMTAAEFAVIKLWLEGHSWDEIGAKLGAGADAVRKRFTRAIGRVREVLD